jgi:murein DD-endopeptidase / murein LD-carboxypeptidase
MLREASISGHISAKAATGSMMKRLSNRIFQGRPFLFSPRHCDDRSPASRRRGEGGGQPISSGITSSLLLIIFLGVTLYLTGCVMTSRYKIETKKEAVPEDSLKEISEESTENDRIVNPDTVLPEIEKIPVNTELNRSKMMKGISGMIGTPYSFSGTDENGIDCSGFTAKIFGQIGKTLPHSTVEQYRMTMPVSENDKRFGDLVFFNTTGESPSHVGIFLGGGYFAHASVSAGVTISSLESTYYKRRYVGMRRLP